MRHSGYSGAQRRRQRRGWKWGPACPDRIKVPARRYSLKRRGETSGRKAGDNAAGKKRGARGLMPPPVSGDARLEQPKPIPWGRLETPRRSGAPDSRIRRDHIRNRWECRTKRDGPGCSAWGETPVEVRQHPVRMARRNWPIEATVGISDAPSNAGPRRQASPAST